MSAKVALCGTGRIGTVHAENIRSIPGIEIVSVVEVLEERCHQYAEKLGAKGYTSLEAALADESNPFSAILCCTPTPTHTEVVQTALRAGKHVFCEKPISLNLQESDDCYALAQEKGVHLLCAFQRRYDDSFKRLKEVVSAGGIGTLQKIRTISRDNPVPHIDYLKTSGGIFHDCLSHDIDLMRWIVGEEPVEVFCYATNFIDEIRQIDDFDNVDCLLKWSNGIIGTIDVSRKAVYGYDQRITCLGDRGMVTAENKKDDTVILATTEGFTTAPNCYSFPTRYPQAYSDEIAHFADLLNGVVTTPIIGLKDVHNNAVIADALEHSARTGAPVQLTNLL
jgi:myo-inositol 2-dehydrogenase/D-chiro-inositol 1-dehydrogenase